MQNSAQSSPVSTQIETALRAAFSPTTLQITNESAKHAGHGGDDGSGESHFAILIRAPELAALSRLDRHRAVHAALGDLVKTIHALALDVK